MPTSFRWATPTSARKWNKSKGLDGVIAQTSYDHLPPTLVGDQFPPGVARPTVVGGRGPVKNFIVWKIETFCGLRVGHIFYARRLWHRE